MWRAENPGVVCERICHVCTVINPPIDICNKSVYSCPCSCSPYEYKKLQYFIKVVSFLILTIIIIYSKNILLTNLSITKLNIIIIIVIILILVKSEVQRLKITQMQTMLQKY